ncbi:MAG: T9SS type A sorting domain-containing protein [Bacteroidia bacterium]|nr:T9SS type A sorting domain-containing protein [Bacteroidia bacterium]
MKKIFTTVLSIAISAAVFAQVGPPSPCTPSLTGPSGDIVPDTITNLPPATQGTSYSTVIQVYVPSDTVVPGLGSLPIQDFTLDSVVGLPSEFGFLSSPETGVFPGGSAACLLIASSGNVSSAPGTYPLNVYVTATVVTPFGPVPQSTSLNGYKIVIDAASSSGCTPSLTGPGGDIVPDTIVNLAVATQGTPYSATIQVYVPSDTVVPGLGNLPIQDFTLDNISGLPAEFSYSSNPATGVFPGGSAACLDLTAANVTSAVGIYPLGVNVTATVVTPFGPVPQSTTINGYKIVIQGPIGYITYDANSFGILANFPNPANESTAIVFGSDKNTSVGLNVYNAIGTLVYTSKVNATQGSNTISVNTSTFAEGNYIYTLSNGNAVANGKFIVIK